MRLELKQIESTITTNKLTWANIGLTAVFTIIVTIIQVQSYNRESRKEDRELKLLAKDSVSKLQRLYND